MQQFVTNEEQKLKVQKKRADKKFMKRAAGQSLVEYSLVIGLVAIVCIGALMVMGTTLSTTFQEMAATWQAGGSSPPANGGQAAQPPLTSNLPELGVGGDFSSWTPANYPVNIRESIETLGGNGTTSQLANTLRAYAEQLLADDAITPEQYNSLINLSNAGHSLANVQQLVEGAVAQADGDRDLLKDLLSSEGMRLLSTSPSGDPDGFWVDSLSFSGSAHQTLADVEARIRKDYEMSGYSYQYDTFEAYLSATANKFPLGVEGSASQNNLREGMLVDYPLDNFEIAYLLAKEQGALGDPRVNDLITFLSNDIFSISKSVGMGHDVDRISEAVETTRGNSQVICTTGNGDSGETVCRPQSGS